MSSQAIARTSGGVHLASLWDESPVDVGVGLVAEHTNDKNDNAFGHYVEVAARAHRTSKGRYWVAGRWERTKLGDQQADSLSLRVDRETISGMYSNGFGDGNGASFIGAGVLGIFGHGLFLESGVSWLENDMRGPFVLIGATVRLPFAFAGAVFH